MEGQGLERCHKHLSTSYFAFGIKDNAACVTVLAGKIKYF